MRNWLSHMQLIMNGNYFEQHMKRAFHPLIHLSVLIENNNRNRDVRDIIVRNRNRDYHVRVSHTEV